VFEAVELSHQLPQRDTHRAVIVDYKHTHRFAGVP
jgi:hypothetical protein